MCAFIGVLHFLCACAGWRPTTYFQGFFFVAMPDAIVSLLQLVHVFGMCLRIFRVIFRGEERFKRTNKQINFFVHRINFITTFAKNYIILSKPNSLIWCVQHLCGCVTSSIS